MNNKKTQDLFIILEKIASANKERPITEILGISQEE